MDIQIKIDQEACIKCGMCISDCPYSILEFSPDFPQADPEREEKCIQCQHCLTVCPTGALSVLGFSPDHSLPLKKGAFPSSKQLELLIKGRRSIRKYQPAPLSSVIIRNMLTTVNYAPTGVNRRQCLFNVVEDQDVMQRIREDTMEGIRAKAKARKLKAGMGYFSAIVKAWDKGTDILFRGAPHMLLVSAPKDLATAREDSIIALSYFELLAASMNIGTLWNGLAYWAFTLIVPEMQKKIGIPESHQLCYVMLFGKPAVQYHRTVQRDNVAMRKITYS